MTSTSSNCLDHKLCEEMSEHIEKLTLSGQKRLDETLMKKLKKICRISDIYVKHAYHLLMSTLEKDHAEIRLSCLKIIDELFNRSHCFRDLLVSEFQTFLELTVAINHDRPIPPPVSVGKMLRSETLKAIQQWFEKYGEAYKKLVLGYNFLKSCKLVDFNDIRNRTIAERQREAEIERKKRIILNQKVDKVIKEMSESLPEMETCVTEMENCLNLLIPTPEDFFIMNEQGSDKSNIQPLTNSDKSSTKETAGSGILSYSNIDVDKDKNSSLDSKKSLSSECHNDLCHSKHSEDLTAQQNTAHESHTSDKSDDSDNDSDDDVDSDMEPNPNDHTAFVSDFGLGTRKYNLDIKISSDNIVVQESEDNRDIFKTLHDSVHLSTKKYLPKISKWLEVLTKAGDNNDKVKQLVDLKSKLQELLNKSVEMKLTKDKDIALESDDDDDDDDFEDVPEKDGYEAEVPLHLLTAAEMGLKEDPKKHRGRKRTNKDWSLSNNSKSSDDPTSREANLRKLGLKDLPSTSNNPDSTVYKGVPIVPFGPDIAHWENPEKMEKPLVIKYDSLHRFWTPAECENESTSKHDMEALTSRTFHYPGKFVPVTWSCRAPLSNGTLCPRMDRQKCPFHGTIIGRSKTGKPTDQKDLEKTIKEQLLKAEGKESDWRDHELEKDIETALGVDLGSNSSKGKGKGKGKGKKKNKKYENLTDISEIKNTSRSRLEKKVFNRRAMKRVTSTLDTADYKRVRDKFGNQFNYAYNK